ncbi:MAG TPA: alcohol dehydrogenase catalytic domain-containing protein [Pseudonocardiaceae bacterium]|jgi:threonine dehydrogenase-like Zn-dependent dehydrogenase
MLALRAHRGAAELALEHIPVPVPGPRDVIVKVAAAGLAPGMMRLLARGAFTHLPTTLGHEAAGTIAALGSDVEDLAVGDRVRVHPNLNCRDCEYCRSDRDMMCAQQAMLGHAAFSRTPMPLYDEYHNGGLAEYVRVPYWLIDRLPDSVSFAVGAKIHDVANAVRALKCADLPVGSTVIVTAVTGTMGTATVKLAEHFGIARLILVGRGRERLEPVARLAGGMPTDIVATAELGEDWAATGALTQRLLELAPDGAHAVIDYVPDGPTTAQAMGALATGGTIVHMGSNATPLSVSPADLMRRCWRFAGTRACTRADALDVLELLGKGALDLDELITHRFPLTDAVKAVDAIQQRTEPIWMAVVNP